MKQLLTALLVLTSISASAKSIVVFDGLTGDANDTTAEFMINQDLGRAWVNIVTSHDWGEDEFEEDNFVKVEGLSFNQDTQEVIYTDETLEVVCATLITRGRGIFKRTKLVASGNCSLVDSVETRSIDDGFRIKKRKYTTVKLQINQ